MDAFDSIFDGAEIYAEAESTPRRQNMGLAVDAPETMESLPAPTNSKKPAKAGKTKAEGPTNTIARSPSSSTNPAEKPVRRKADAAAKTRSQLPSVATNPADEAGKMSARAATNPIDSSRSSSPISDGGSAIGSDSAVLSPRITQWTPDGAVAIIQAEWRMRQRWHKAEKALILQAKALLRGLTDGDKTAANELFEAALKDQAPIEAMIALAPFLPAISRFEEERKNIEKTMAKRAKSIPAYEWATSFKGLGAGSFVSIVGEAGDIGSFRSVSGLWKYMGLAVIGGGRQRKCANADDAAIHKYNPSRRSVMWNAGGALIGVMGHGPRPSPGEDISARDDWTYWQKLFVERCRYEAARDPEKKPVREGKDKKTGEPREAYTLHTQARAKRYVEKRFLRKLYARWRLETLGNSGDPEDEITLPLAAE